MTVSELIELLKTMPQDATIELTSTAGCTPDVETWYWQSEHNGEFLFLSPKE
jgi:hypothetical protein